MVNRLLSKIKKHGLKNSALRVLLHIGSATASPRKKYFYSYSQYGEDFILDILIGNKKTGTYVDIGAYDPHELSNTKRFHRRGWSGINIEPNCANYQKFLKDRPQDTNLNIGIGPENGSFDFYLFEADALNTFSKEEADKYIKLGNKLKEKRKVELRPLRDVLSQCDMKNIDIMTIDTEGFEMEVLQSNDWEKFRPKLICVEVADHADGTINKQVEGLLASHGYKLIFFNGLNEIWQDKKR